MESRLARSNAEASVERSLQEPKPHRINSDLAQGLLSATDDIARSVLALDAYLIDKPERHALPEVSPFTAKVDEALRLLVASIREEQPVTALPDLQEALHALEHASKSSQMRREVHADLHFVLSEAKKIVSNINAMKQLLSLPY